MDPEMAALVESARLTVANNYASVAFLMLLLYDIAITFGDEVRFVWDQQGMSLGKALFFMNRYIVPLDLIILINTYANPSINQDICIPWFKIDNWLSVLSLAVVDLILLLRTWALWNRNKKVLWTSLAVFIVCTLATTGAVVYFSLAVFSVPFPTQIRPCFNAFKQLNVVEAVWGSTILFDTTILVFTLAKILPQFRSKTATILLREIYKDGFIYFGVMFAISLANIFVFALAPADFKLTLVTLQRVMYSLLASRIVLNLRGVLTRRSLGSVDGTVFEPENELTTLDAHRGSRPRSIGITTVGGTPMTPPGSPRRRVISALPSKRQLDSFGYVVDDDDDERDDWSPADESPQTPWSTPWNAFRVPVSSLEEGVAKSQEPGVEESLPHDVRISQAHGSLEEVDQNQIGETLQHHHHI